MKILVVDDSSTMRRIISNTLTNLGHEDIVQAVDGQDALVKVDENPDLEFVFSDWNMPNMNGLEFLKKFREKNKGIPFVMVTTESEKESVVEAIKNGASNYVVKPFTPDVLKEKMDAAMKK